MIKFLTSTVGKKYIMGLSGTIWLGFIFAHMAGNFLLFVGADAYNKYSQALLDNPATYAIEALLVLAIFTHVFLAINLTLANRSARGTRYAADSYSDKRGTLASRTMAIQGSVILAFIILHLATFKFGTVYMTTVDGREIRDLHRLVVEVFAQPGYVLWYVVALILLAFHVKHGVRSVFQSFGLLHPSYQNLICKVSWGYAIVVVGGFLSQPIYVYLLSN